jgi:L-ascorbate metabolism protein UlaG (beta-lactamase superfamily)
MKVTRYFQSCLLIEEGKARILIDPSGHEKDHIDKLGELDAVLYTHEHSDHFDAEMAQTFVEQGIAPVYANASTAKLIKASKTVVKDGQEFKINGVKIKVIELPHCLMPNDSAGPQNVGYLINGKFFHPGDGVELAGLSVDNLALPITGPDVSMKDAFAFAKQLGAKNVIPIHYDKIGANPEVYATFAGFFPEFKFKFHILKQDTSAEF